MTDNEDFGMLQSTCSDDTENIALPVIPGNDIDLTPATAASLDYEEQQLVDQIIEAPNREILEQRFELFNVNQSKKNALRVIKLNGLLDKVEDEVIDRFNKRPDQISNKELLEYMNTVSAQIDKAQSGANSLSATPPIRVTNQKNEVNINVGTELDRDGKERVMDAISGLLDQLKRNKQTSDQIIEGEIVKNDTEVKNLDNDIVCNDIDTITTSTENILNSQTENFDENKS